MPKFFTAGSDLNAGSVELSGQNAEHLRVLRVRPGEEIVVSDGRGLDARCVVERMERGSCFLRVEETYPSKGEASVAVTVCAALPKGDKAETIVQKAVELGAADIVFFLSSRCVSRPDRRAAEGKTARLRKVAEAAAMQSGRGIVPDVLWIPDYREMTARAAKADFTAFLWEEETERSLGTLMRAAQPFRTAALITGPEGGFSAEEAQQALQAGIPAATLGPRILRCETAPLCALTALMYETGNLG